MEVKKECGTSFYSIPRPSCIVPLLAFIVKRSLTIFYLLSAFTLLMHERECMNDKFLREEGAYLSNFLHLLLNSLNVPQR